LRGEKSPNNYAISNLYFIFAWLNFKRYD